MQIRDTVIKGVLILKPLEKRIDASTATEFKSRVVDFINAGNAKIVIDLADVDFIDSSGLGAFVSTLKTMGEHGELALCGIKATVMSLFRLTRMDKVFRIFSTDREAAEKLSG